MEVTTNPWLPTRPPAQQGQLLGPSHSCRSDVAWEPFWSRATGAFYYSLCGATGEPGCLHSEITGYFLSLASRLPDTSPQWSDVACGAARFLRGIQTDEGAFPHSVDSTPRREHEWHAFDVGIAAVGLFDHAESVGDRESLAAAERAVDWVETAWQSDDQGFHATWDNKRRKWLDKERAGFWSSSGGCYHGKLLLPLIRADRWAMADRLGSWLLRLQKPDGAFPATTSLPASHSHASCYALEGLLELTCRTGEKSHAEAFQRGMRWLAEQIVEHSGLPTWIPGESSYRADAQIQFERLCLLSGMAEEFALPVSLCRGRLQSMRSPLGWVQEAPSRDGSLRIPSWSFVFRESLRFGVPGERTWLI